MGSNLRFNATLRSQAIPTTATVFHFNTREANGPLTINLEGTPLSYSSTPTYLGVKLDRQLTFRQQLEG